MKPLAFCPYCLKESGMYIAMDVVKIEGKKITFKCRICGRKYEMVEV